jgi:polar amino acid transport system permease protein
MAMSPRKRAQVSRWIQYGILAVLAVVVALAADWKSLAEDFADPEIIAGMFPEVITTALKNTILYTASGFLLGLALGLVLALMRLSPVGP